MPHNTKEVQGQLLDRDSKEVLSKALVTISLFQSKKPNDYPEYQVKLTVSGYKPELDSKIHHLRLTQDIIGEVFISIPVDDHPSRTRTRFNVILQDNVWNNLEWFKNL